MFLKITCSKQQRQIQKLAIATATLFSIFFLNTHSGNTEESPQNSLPPPPDTGSPEEDFSAGGTRENHRFTQRGSWSESTRRLDMLSSREHPSPSLDLNAWGDRASILVGGNTCWGKLSP